MFQADFVSFQQPNICEFPSKYFYDGKLKTASSVPVHDPRLQWFWPAQRTGGNFPIAFCHVEGQEEASAIRTAASNEQSKANMKEVEKVVSTLFNISPNLICIINVFLSTLVVTKHKYTEDFHVNCRFYFLRPESTMKSLIMQTFKVERLFFFS